MLRTDPAFPTGRALRRAALVAGSTAAAALLALLPAASSGPDHLAPTTSTLPAPPVRLVAATRPAAPAALPALQVATAVAPATARSAALQRALGKVGAQYRFGAAGPTAFDCSGLVMWAYQGAGRTLPHSSRAMAHVGTPVSKGALQPGDLVFFYSGPSHVAIYVGNGKVVHASNPSHPVKLADLGSMPFNSARRV